MALNQRGGLDPVEYRKFAGIRNTVSPERFDIGALEAAVNIDLDDTGRASRRKGYTSALAAAGAHSLHAEGDLCVFVQGTSLKRLASDYTASALRTVTASRRVEYASVLGRLFYSNGAETGVIDGGASRTWGLVPPAHVGQAAAVGGGQLPAGRYQWTVTFVRTDGQESGALITAALDLPTVSGIAFSGLPVSSDPGVVAKIIYLTHANDEVMREALVLDAADTTAAYMNDGTEMAGELRTRYLQNPPAGQCVSYFRGHTIVAVGSVLYPSVPYGYELFDLRRYFDFESPITLIAPVESGVFVCTEAVNYFLPGLTPDDWKQKTATAEGAIPGTLVYVDGEDVGAGTPGRVALWLSRAGVCMGLDDGSFKVANRNRLLTSIVRASGASTVIGGRFVSTAE